MKQLNLLSILITFVLLLLTPSLTAAMISEEATKIPYQVSNSDRIIIGTVSKIDEYNKYTIFTITVKEWLYNPLPTETINVRTESGTNSWTEDEVELAFNESALLFLKDENLDKQLFRVPLGVKYSVSDRDAVIEELKYQGKWQDKNPIGNMSRNTGTEKSSEKEGGKQLNNSEHNNDKPFPLPDYSQKAFDEAKKLFPGFITTRGTMPEIPEEDKGIWINSLTKGSRPIPANTELSTYFVASGGPVNSFGADIHGYLLVGFDSSTPEKVNESVIDKVYQIIDKHFEQENIKNVPVVFTFIKITNDTLLINNNDTNLEGNKEKIDGNGTTNQMLGFTSIMAILGLLAMLIVKR
jgi:hypothetical protein